MFVKPEFAQKYFAIQEYHLLNHSLHCGNLNSCITDTQVS